MTMISIELHDAKQAYLLKDFVSAKKLLDQVIEGASDSAEEFGARYLRARGYEDGHFAGGIDLEKAYADYAVLAKAPEIAGSEGLVGRARILYEWDAVANQSEIMTLCDEAAKLGNVKAMMIMGQLNEQVFFDDETARRWYMRAFKSGLPWGMRYIARSYARNGCAIRAFFAHLAASLASPFLTLRFGVRSPFH